MISLIEVTNKSDSLKSVDDKPVAKMLGLGLGVTTGGIALKQLSDRMKMRQALKNMEKARNEL